MKTYKSHKTVQAAKIVGFDTTPGGAILTLQGDATEVREAVNARWLEKNSSPDHDLVGGYFVRYADGYTSWSPAAAFEEGYTLDDGGFKAPPVAGYNSQTAAALAIVNGNKAVEEETLRILDGLPTAFPDIDGRWLSIGRTHMEQAWMAINRAVFKPGRVKLPEDQPAQQQDT